MLMCCVVIFKFTFQITLDNKKNKPKAFSVFSLLDANDKSVS